MEEKRKISKYNNEYNSYLLRIVLKKNLWLIILFFIIIISIIWAFLRYTQPIYQAKTIIQLNTENRVTELISSNTLARDNSLENRVEVLSSPEFIKRVIRKLPLDLSVYAKGNILDFELYKTAPFSIEYSIIDSSIINVPIHFKIKDNKNIELYYEFNGQTIQIKEKIADTIFTQHLKLYIKPSIDMADGEYYFIINDFGNLVRKYRNQLSINIINGNAGSVELSFNDENPVKCIDFLNTVIQEYKSFDVEQRTQSARSMLDFIDQQIAALDQIMNQGDIPNSSLNLPPDTFTSVLSIKQEIKQLQTEKEQLNDEVLNIKNALSVLENDSFNTSKLIVYLAQSNYYSVLSTFINEYRLLIEQYANLSTVYSQNTTAIEQILWKIQYSKNSLKDVLQTLLDKSKYQLTIANKKLQDLQHYLYSYSSNSFIASTMEATNISQPSSKYYEQFLDRRLEYTLYIAGIVSDIVVLEEPTLLSSPIYPNKTKTIVMGLFIFLMIAVITLIWKYISYTNILSIEDIEPHIKDNLVITLPLFTGDLSNNLLVIHKYKRSLLAESFRKIKSHLLLRDTNIPKIIVVTSTISGEGKTFVAINLGGILALSNKKVLIIDTDLRRPKMSITFNNLNDFGLSNYLLGECNIEQCIKATEINNLFYFPAGSLPEYPNELLTSSKMDELLENLKKYYDIIILDTPPIGLISDTTKFVLLADTTVYVFRSEYSKKEFIVNLEKLKQELNPKEIIIVLNGFNDKFIKQSKYGKYGYEYKYDIYGYYTDNEEKQSNTKKSMKKYFNYFYKKNK
ncbi:MAG TPA: polysaccharide biosynthesis tyrosine autokinase [Bacteroidales bacterium]|nr:polysaccharide biosynthesis tyrosine autokinase [Bacteroidales bacterium]